MANPILRLTIKTETRGDVMMRDILREYRDVGTKEVRVGIIEPGRKYPDSSVTLGEVALWNEFGTHDKSGKQLTPARSFLRTPTDLAENELFQRKLALLAAIADKKINVNAALRSLGSFLLNSIRQTIKKRINPPLRPYTLAQRRKRQITGTIPLYATQWLYKNIGFAVRGQKEGE